MKVDRDVLREVYNKNQVQALEEAADPIETIKEEIVLFLKNKGLYVGGRGIIGLSGGVDSSVIAYLAVEALGKENVLGVILPSDSNQSTDRKHAELVASKLGMQYRVIPIQPIVEAYRKITPSLFEDKIAEGNLKARIRMTELYALANNGFGMVIGTDNKTEGSIGYFTKYGDGGVDINPIGGLYKTQVRILARHLGVPDEIINKAPSAGLWEDQTDEGEIGMSYEKLDSILLGYDLGFPGAPEHPDYARVNQLIRNSEHKREMPPSPEVIKYA